MTLRELFVLAVLVSAGTARNGRPFAARTLSRLVTSRSVSRTAAS